VEIKAIAREPGFRSKVAVAARQPGVDPVGSCVGLRGIRIQNIVNELSGERIDVVLWHADPAAFIANALSPAQVARVEISEAEKTATVVVADRQLSLAIGKEGQNARLAAKLSGWRIDIKPSSVADAEQAEKEAQKAKQAAVAVPAEAPTPPAAVAAAEVAPPAPEPVASAEAVAVAEAVATAEKVLVEEAVAKPVAVEASPFPAAPQVRFAEDVGIATRGKPDVRAKKTKKKGAPGAKKDDSEGDRAKRPRKAVASRWEGAGEEEEEESEY
ncbi:MAG: KH domain-containing protein, partial [Chloroflexota bacterium]|nr:KH domain-containing protein [Chloroflexota bacterium]